MATLIPGCTSPSSCILLFSSSFTREKTSASSPSPRGLHSAGGRGPAGLSMPFCWGRVGGCSHSAPSTERGCQGQGKNENYTLVSAALWVSKGRRKCSSAQRKKGVAFNGTATLKADFSSQRKSEDNGLALRKRSTFPRASAAAAAKSLQLCPTLCDPIDGSPPGPAVPGILQARTLEWVAISSSNA